MGAYSSKYGIFPRMSCRLAPTYLALNIVMNEILLSRNTVNCLLLLLNKNYLFYFAYLQVCRSKNVKMLTEGLGDHPKEIKMLLLSARRLN